MQIMVLNENAKTFVKIYVSLDIIYILILTILKWQICTKFFEKSSIKER